MNLKTMSWLCGLLGFALLIAGLAQWSVPLACVVAGLVLVAYAYLLDRAAAVATQAQRKAQQRPGGEG